MDVRIEAALTSNDHLLQQHMVYAWIDFGYIASRARRQACQSEREVASEVSPHLQIHIANDHT